MHVAAVSEKIYDRFNMHCSLTEKLLHVLDRSVASLQMLKLLHKTWILHVIFISSACSSRPVYLIVLIQCQTSIILAGNNFLLTVKTCA